jgi:hypothetical protein
MINMLQALWSDPDPYGSFIVSIYVFFIFIVLLIEFLPAIAQYVVTSIGLHRLGNKHGVPRAGLAWLPIGNMYVLGSLADLGAEHNGADKPGYRKRLVGLAIPITVIGGVMVFSLLFIVLVAIVMGLMGILPETPTALIAIPVLICFGGFIPMFILGIKFAICMYKGLWQIYRMYSKNLAILYLLLSIFVPLSMGIIMNVLVGKTPTEPAAADTEEPIDPTVYSV